MKPKMGHFVIEEKGFTDPTVKRKHELDRLFGYEEEDEE
jgi:hypothetical protein